MAAVIDIEGRKPRVQPITILNPADWQGKPIPERQWLVHGVCIRGGATLINGDGGVGKSLLCMQLQTALALGKPWLGLPTPQAGTRSLGIYCEDSEDELHRRQADICEYYRCEMDDLAENVMMMSRVGADTNTLMQFDRRSGVGAVTNFFRQVEAIISEQRIEVIIIDTAADTFGGKEIDREEVRTFIQRLRGWALRSNGSVVITQHPSVSGMASGAGSSGSTGWNNSVRSRLYLTAPKHQDDDGDEIPTDVRFLKVMKSNYGPKNAKLRLTWKEGVFRLQSEVGEQNLFDLVQTCDMLLDLAESFVRQGIEIAADPNVNSGLVRRARTHLKLAQISQGDLYRAQERLVAEMKLSVVDVKKKNRHVGTLIRPSWLKYASEQSEGNP